MMRTDVRLLEELGIDPASATDEGFVIEVLPSGNYMVRWHGFKDVSRSDLLAALQVVETENDAELSRLIKEF